MGRIKRMAKDMVAGKISKITSYIQQNNLHKKNNFKNYNDEKNNDYNGIISSSVFNKYRCSKPILY